MSKKTAAASAQEQPVLLEEADGITKHLEWRDVEPLVPYANNARTHSPEQIDQLVASYHEWGATNPIIIDENDMIIAGHGRRQALMRMGQERVRVLVIRGWSEAKKRQYILADNKLVLNAGWDERALGLEISSLAEMGLDLSLTGFNPDELKELAITDDFNDEAADDDEEKVLKEPEFCSVKVGPFSIKIATTEFDRWVAEMRECHGQSDKSVEDGILERLRLESPR